MLIQLRAKRSLAYFIAVSYSIYALSDDFFAAFLSFDFVLNELLLL
jgi:hypothetical protein